MYKLTSKYGQHLPNQSQFSQYFVKTHKDRTCSQRLQIDCFNAVERVFSRDEGDIEQPRNLEGGCFRNPIEGSATYCIDTGIDTNASF
jgi:hypothetical protein